MDKAEIDQAGEWQGISATDAHVARYGRLRRASRHGKVYVAGSYMNSDGRYRFTHHRSFPGCGESRGEVPLRHPQPVA
jgi:hypothetical protein